LACCNSSSACLRSVISRPYTLMIPLIYGFS